MSSLLLDLSVQGSGVAVLAWSAVQGSGVAVLAWSAVPTGFASNLGWFLLFVFLLLLGLLKICRRLILVLNKIKSSKLLV